MPLGVRIIAVLLASIASGVLYRMGGSGNYPRQSRVVGISTISCIVLYILGFHSWWLFLVFGLTCASIATYWDFLFHDVDNFFMHGLMIGLSCLPLLACGVHWYAILLRSVCLSLAMGLWCNARTNDVEEEVGRGAAIIATLPLLLI